MKKVIIMLMLVFFSTLGYATTETNSFTLPSQQTYNGIACINIRPEVDIVIKNITKISTESANTGAIYNKSDSSVLLNSSSFVGDIAIISYDVAAGELVRVCTHNGGTNRNNRYETGVTIPEDTGNIQWIEGSAQGWGVGTWSNTSNTVFSILSVGYELLTECDEDLVNTTDFGWSNYTNCHEPYLRAWQQLQRNYTRYDNNTCGTYSNFTYYEYLNISCDTFIYTNDFNNDEMILALVVFDLVMTALVIWLLFNGKIIPGIFLGLVSIGVDFMLTGYMNENMMVYANTTLFGLGMAIFTYVLPVAKASLLVLGSKRG